MNNPSKEIKEKIDFLWNKNRGKSFESFVKINEDVRNYLDDLVNSDKWFQNIRRAFVCIANGIYEKKCCQVCGKELDLIKACKGRKFCSRSCASKYNNSKRVYDEKKIYQSIEKRKKTNLEKFGVQHPMQSSQVRKKYEQTCLKKYGVANAIQDASIYSKMKQSLFDRYGVDNPFKSDEIQKKKVETNLKRYGVRSTFLVESVREKGKNTLLQRYGVDNPFKSKAIREKSELTCLKKYGSRNISQSMERMKQIMKESYNRFALWKDYVVPMFTLEEYMGRNNKEYHWKCVRCGNEFSQHIHTTNFDGKSGYIPRCTNCFPYNKFCSNLEKDILKFIRSIYDGEIIENDRIILHGKELDIYIPEKKLAIEFDGLFWHNENCGKDADYHLNKTERCQNKDIQLLHIFEDEWIKKQEIVKDRIKSLLGIYDQKIYARKCNISKVGKKSCDEFLEINHLQGKDNASIRYGLYYEDELVAVMTFGKPRFNKNYDFELIRFASKLGIQVIGGAGKLLSEFRNSYNNYSIISYADRRYSRGKMYTNIGFVKSHVSNPNYWWVYGQNKLSRYQCQKHKLKSILGEKFNQDLSESENMLLNGYNKIYDCGNIVFIIQ